MSVKASSPDAAAANPAHPDHARWVKERTLALEVEHAQRLGGTLRDAEVTNQRLLERMDARKRERKPSGRKPRSFDTARREVTREELRAAGVRKRPAQIVKPRPLPCGGCGLCLACRRLARSAEIIRRCKAGEAQLSPLVNQLAMMTLAYSLQRRLRDFGAEFPFDHPSLAVRLRALDAVTDRICDRSTGILGEWR